MSTPLFFDLEIDVRYEPNEQRFVARAEEYPECQGLGVTPYDAAFELKGAIEIWLRMCAGKPPLGDRQYIPRRTAPPTRSPEGPTLIQILEQNRGLR